MIGELRSAPPDATVILAMHQPVYSVDVVHGSNLSLGDLLDTCFTLAGRVPDAVLTGHAHNYQRFTRRIHGREVPYIVAGSGGFHERHEVGADMPDMPAAFTGLPDVTLEGYQCTRHGFMTITVSRSGAEVAYTTVADGTTCRFDSFRIDPGRLI